MNNKLPDKVSEDEIKKNLKEIRLRCDRLVRLLSLELAKQSITLNWKTISDTEEAERYLLSALRSLGG